MTHKLGRYLPTPSKAEGNSRVISFRLDDTSLRKLGITKWPGESYPEAARRILVTALKQDLPDPKPSKPRPKKEPKDEGEEPAIWHVMRDICNVLALPPTGLTWVPDLVGQLLQAQWSMQVIREGMLWAQKNGRMEFRPHSSMTPLTPTEIMRCPLTAGEDPLSYARVK